MDPAKRYPPNKYTYDSHGNQTVASHSDATKTRTVDYSMDDRAYEMRNAGQTTRFWYGVGGDRYKRQDISATGTKTTINVANLEIETVGNLTTTRRTVAGVYLEVSYKYAPPSKLLRVTDYKYLHHDQLGNVVRITDANGVVLEKLDFDAYGARRNVIDPRQHRSPGCASPTRVDKAQPGLLAEQSGKPNQNPTTVVDQYKVNEDMRDNVNVRCGEIYCDVKINVTVAGDENNCGHPELSC